MHNKKTLFPVMLFFYRIVLYSLSPFLILRLLWKSVKQPNYRKNIGARFGFNLPASKNIDIWIHAVSLGEINAALPLIEALLKQNQSLLITTTTATGRTQAKNKLGERVLFSFFPFDMPWVINKFLGHFKPKKIIIMETELWPNLILSAQKKRIPLYLFNGRLSARSFSHYRLIKQFMQPLLTHFTYIAAQSKEDADRFIQLGAPIEKVHVLGNVKFDLEISQIDFTPLTTLQKLKTNKHPLLMLASTHAPEESLWLQALPTLKKVIPNLIILIAPRHPERFKEVFNLCEQQGFKTAMKSTWTQTQTPIEIILIDSIGELQALYQLADFAFVGGSLAPVGGHNLLEPIAVGTPTLTGPYLSNFNHIASLLRKERAIIIRDNIEMLTQEIITLYQNDDKRTHLIKQAQKVLQLNKGAASKHIELLRKKV